MTGNLQVDTLFENRYRILDVLGQGGMGTVYRVADEAHDGQVLALKVLTIATRLPGIAADFRREFSILTQLRHPNLVGVHEYGVAGTGELYFTMEHLPGQSLKSYLLGKPLADAFPFIVQVCRALAYLHARGILHGDLKPSNILVVDGQACLLDFGIAREVGGQLPPGSVTSGTLGYMAPEIRDRKAVDHRADLYSLGALMYELITGTPPEFLVGAERLTVLALEDALIGRNEPYPDLIPVVTQLMAAAPVDRYPGANAVIDAISGATGNTYALETRETAVSYALRGRFVGREAEVAMLQAAWGRAQAGDGPIVLVGGASGTGKSRLVEEFTLQSELSGAWVVRGRCSESGRSAYQPWREALRVLVRYVENSDPAGMQRLGPVLAALLPELWQRAYLADAAAPPALDPEAERLRLNETLYQFLKLATAIRPTLIAIDDAQWSDEASLELLGLLSRVPPLADLLVVVAYRDDEIAAAHPLAALAGRKVERLQLQDLSSTSVSELVGSMLGLAALPPLLLERVQHTAAGNAFFVQELVRSLAEDGRVLRRTVGGWEVDTLALAATAMPASIRQVVLRRLGHLSALEQTVLHVAAVLGVRFWDGALLSLGALTREQTESTLQALLEKDWIAAWDRTSFVGQAEYAFKHAMLRDFVYEHLAQERRVAYHRQAAEWLVACSAERGEEYAAQLAEHYEYGGDTVAAGEWYGRAGKRAQETYASEAALHYYRKALSYLDETPVALDKQNRPAERMDVLLRLGSVTNLLGQSEESEQYYLEGLSSAERAADRIGAAHCQHALGELAWQRGNYAAALEWLRQAQAIWETLADYAQLGQVHKDTGAVYWRTGEYALAQRYLNESLACARQVGDGRGMARALHMLGNVAYEQGDLTAARALCAESLALAREQGNKVEIANSLNTLGNVACEQGDYATARALHEESLLLKREVGDKRGEAKSLTNLGNALWEQGDYAGAQSLYADSLALKQEMGDQWGVMMLHYVLGFTAVEQQDYARAFALHTTSLAQALAIGNRLYVVYNLVGIAAVAMVNDAALRASRLAAAAETLLAAINSAMETAVRRQFERTTAAARAALGEEAFQTAWAEGEQLSLEEAVTYALEA